MFLTIGLFVLGLAGLFLGGDWLVKGASGIATRFRVPPLVIGLTVVGFGTSTPELLVSVQAALAGSPGIAIGNVVGSNTANILLILGLSAVVAPVGVAFARVRGDLAWMLAAAVVTVPMFWSGMLGRIEGAILFGGIVAYILNALRQVGADDAPQEGELPGWLGAAGFTALGLVTLMVGARFLVDSASDLARTFGVAEAVIGLTVVAVGTSLPELATSITAAIKGQREIALGNVIGSNVFNILAVLGATALIAPVPVEARFLMLDVPVMIAVSVLLAALLALRGGIGRIGGAAFLIGYVAYVWVSAGVS